MKATVNPPTSFSPWHVVSMFLGIMCGIIATIKGASIFGVIGWTLLGTFSISIIGMTIAFVCIVLALIAAIIEDHLK